MESVDGAVGRSSGHFIHRGLIKLIARTFWPTRSGGWPKTSWRTHFYAVKVWRIFLASGQYFGRSALYQSFEPLDLPGNRPTAKRMEAYGLTDKLHSEATVLDVGCNMGALGVSASAYAKHVTGIDIDDSLIEIASVLAQAVAADNTEFVASSVMDFQSETPFDVILCCAVFSWSGASLDQFISKISSLAAPGALILYESNNYDRTSDSFELEVAAFCNAGYSNVGCGETLFETRRRFYWLKKG